jgi:hypothetical protein
VADLPTVVRHRWLDGGPFASIGFDRDVEGCGEIRHALKPAYLLGLSVKNGWKNVKRNVKRGVNY